MFDNCYFVVDKFKRFVVNELYNMSLSTFQFEFVFLYNVCAGKLLVAS